jgi:CheY-like chemotaxis protein
MPMDDFVKLLDALSRLIGALALPVVVVYVLIRFGPDLREFFRNLNEFTFKGPGFEASAKRKQAEAVGALVAAAVSRGADGGSTETITRDASAAATAASEAVTPRIVRQAAKATVLWVDDRPDNNVHERQALEALGVSFVLSTSTEDALELLRQRRFDAVISDMGRGLDQKAGYTLLQTLRKTGDRTPFIIYAGSDAAEHRAEAKQKGALDTTNRPDELFRLVLSVIGRIPDSQ